MAQCKLSDCRERAVTGPWRKRYCQTHGERYLKRQREYAARQKTFPDCASGIAPDCAGKVSLARQKYGHGVCTQCEAAGEVLDRARQKARAFENAETVHDLKEWIREHLL